ncbi:mitochondrial mRNA catabolic process [Desmophyllum pertusum]|uniref:Mitochondrial mRNA catabolic process n=1 Tax=Desmophyllum pertusum TaxID=174260 RepID=A0A9X0D0K7_9CNID|nr:mitochondrial mRNA catabolic process [Desmophyllum pertusum]
MQRSKSEILSKALARIELSSKKKAKKAKKNADCHEAGDTEEGMASLWFNGELVATSLTNEAAWKDGVTLKIGSETFSVELNPPTIKSLLLPDNIMSGFPVMPSLQLEFGEKQFCNYIWYKSTNHGDEQASSVPASAKEVLNWEAVGNEFLYTPSLLDVGCYLKLICTPGNARKASEVTSEMTSSVRVAAGPGDCPFDARHLYTKKQTADFSTFRVMSYNILADTYSKDEFAQKVLYPYCPPYALDISYRQQLLLKEIPGYNADLICLQECGLRLFQFNLSPALETMGFEGLLRCKAGEVPEGEATFFRKSKFALISQHDIVLNEALLGDPAQEVVLDKISALPILLETLQKRNAIVQLSILKVLGFENQYLCVVNTHLYFKPTYPHIRMLQVAIILNHVQKVISQFCAGGVDDGVDIPVHVAADTSHRSPQIVEDGMHSRPQVAVMFCGDFNSIPRNGLLELLTTGHVDSVHRDWTVCEDKEQHCTTLSISHDLNLFSACGFPPFTNYTGGFKGTLDYIFADKKYLEVESVVPLPSEEDLSPHLALPSVVMPSDHLALVCDVKWKL